VRALTGLHLALGGSRRYRPLMGEVNPKDQLDVAGG
jgi:hypothetical protein